MERLIGTIRRECLDHVIVFNATSLRRTLFSYLTCYYQSRTHLSLEKDAPESPPVQPRELGNVVATPEAGGLHHRYERRIDSPAQRGRFPLSEGDVTVTRGQGGVSDSHRQTAKSRKLVSVVMLAC